MKICRYFHNSKQSFGILTDNKIVDIPANWNGKNPPRSVKHLLEMGLESLNGFDPAKHESLDADKCTFLTPIEKPGKILALAGNYSEHIKECGLSLGLSDKPKGDTTPRPFIMPNSVLAGDGDTIPWPVYSQQIDHEVELTIVIGKSAKCVTAEKASDYIAGFTIANDISARSVTFKQDRAERPWDNFYDWLNGKWADGFLPVGPCITTIDEIGDPQNLDIMLKVNGKVRQNANTRQMIYPVNEIVSFLSHLMTLSPGDLICTGTPAGVGHATKNYLNEGDEILCKIEKIGTLTNKLGKKPKSFYMPLKK